MTKKQYFYATLAAILVISIAAFFGVATYEMAHTSYALRHDTDQITQHIIVQVDGLDLKTISLHADDLIRVTRATVDHADRTATKESKYLDDWNAAVTKTLNGLDGLVDHVDQNQSQITTATVGTLSAATSTIQAVQPVLDQTKTTVATTNDAVNDLDKFINSSSITATLDNASKITSSFASISDTTDKVTKKAAAPYLKPPSKNPIKRFLGTAGMYAGPVLRIVAAVI